MQDYKDIDEWSEEELENYRRRFWEEKEKGTAEGSNRRQDIHRRDELNRRLWGGIAHDGS